MCQKSKIKKYKGNQRKKTKSYKGTPIRPFSRLLSKKTLSVRKKWNEIHKILKDKNCQLRLHYPAKLFFKYEGEINTSPDKG